MKTTDLRTAAQQALEALGHVVRQAQENLVPTIHYGPVHDVMNNLRAALAQDQAEPLNLLDRAVQRRLAAQWGHVPAQIESKPLEPDIAKIVSDNLGKLYVEDPAEPAQEPVGEILPNWSTEQERISGTCVYLNDLGKKLPVGTKLYSSPPKAELAQEPEGLDWRYTARIGYVVKPYTAPPQRKPLIG